MMVAFEGPRASNFLLEFPPVFTITATTTSAAAAAARSRVEQRAKTAEPGRVKKGGIQGDEARVRISGRDTAKKREHRTLVARRNAEQGGGKKKSAVDRVREEVSLRGRDEGTRRRMKRRRKREKKVEREGSGERRRKRGGG